MVRDGPNPRPLQSGRVLRERAEFNVPIVLSWTTVVIGLETCGIGNPTNWSSDPTKRGLGRTPPTSTYFAREAVAPSLGTNVPGRSFSSFGSTISNTDELQHGIGAV